MIKNDQNFFLTGGIVWITVGITYTDTKQMYYI